MTISLTSKWQDFCYYSYCSDFKYYFLQILNGVSFKIDQFKVKCAKGYWMCFSIWHHSLIKIIPKSSIFTNHVHSTRECNFSTRVCDSVHREARVHPVQVLSSGVGYILHRCILWRSCLGEGREKEGTLTRWPCPSPLLGLVWGGVGGEGKAEGGRVPN